MKRIDIEVSLTMSLEEAMKLEEALAYYENTQEIIEQSESVAAIKASLSSQLRRAEEVLNESAAAAGAQEVAA